MTEKVRRLHSTLRIYAVDISNRNITILHFVCPSTNLHLFEATPREANPEMVVDEAEVDDIKC